MGTAERVAVSNNPPMKSICLVGLDNYPVLNPAFSATYIGGESVQQTLLARAFAELGLQVSTVVKDYGQQDEEVIGAIHVLKTYRPGAGLPVLRFLHPRMSSVWRALGKADADVYYQSCAGALTGIVAEFCRQRGKIFVFRIAHDSDCLPGQQLIQYWRDRKIYEYGLRHAHLIAAQGTRQVDLLRDNYRLESVPVNMAVELPTGSDPVNRDIDVLWVNNLRPFKRPELAIALARSLPNRRVVMIGGPAPGMEDYYERVRDEARQVANLEFRGALPYAQVNQEMLRAKVFVNTSESEGFPNSFLQAWVRKVPVVSYFDPDGLIRQHGLGGVPGTPDEMVRMVENLLTEDALRRDVGSRAEAFVVARYAPASVASRYLELLSGTGLQD